MKIEVVKKITQHFLSPPTGTYRHAIPGPENEEAKRECKGKSFVDGSGR